MSYGYAGAAIGVVLVFLLCLQRLPDRAARLLFVTVPLGLGLLIAIAFGFLLSLPVPGRP